MSNKLESERIDGLQAEYLLEHPLFVQAFDTIRTEISKQWAQSPARDVDGRERLWLMSRLLDRIESHIKTIATTGKMANAQIAEIEKRRRFFS